MFYAIRKADTVKGMTVKLGGYPGMILRQIRKLKPVIRQNCVNKVKQQPIKLYYLGERCRGVGKALGMNKANVYRWIKERVSMRITLTPFWSWMSCIGS
jgi:hypothetical protein